MLGINTDWLDDPVVVVVIFGIFATSTTFPLKFSLLIVRVVVDKIVIVELSVSELSGFVLGMDSEHREINGINPALERAEVRRSAGEVRRRLIFQGPLAAL